MVHDEVLVIGLPQRAQQTVTKPPVRLTRQRGSFPSAPDEFLLQLLHTAFEQP